MLSDVMLATFTSTKFRGRKEAVLCDFGVNATTERNPAYLCSEENLIPNCQVNVALQFFFYRNFNYESCEFSCN